MAQNRILTILLFVCLSLCFEIAQSLQAFGDPCMESSECTTKCCWRFSPRGSGQCTSSSNDKCYGPDDLQRCYHNNECKSGCCSSFGSGAKCAPSCSKKQKCVGPEIGDLCYSSEQCKSRCCYMKKTPESVPECAAKEEGRICLGREVGDPCELYSECDSGCCLKPFFHFNYKSKCAAKAREGMPCDKWPAIGKFMHCPCEEGLNCDDGICKKRTPGNHHCT